MMTENEPPEVKPGHAIVQGQPSGYRVYIDSFCPWCGSNAGTVRVAGHEQCVTCHNVTESCCDG